MIKKFIILTTPRSGSTWLVDMLNSHPQVTIYSELFLQQDQEKPVWAGEKDIYLFNAYRKRLGYKGNSLVRPFTCLKYLNSVYSPQKDVSAIGFKMMYFQLRSYPEIFIYMLANKVSIVHLIRKNYLDVILSRETRAASGVTHSFNKTDAMQIDLNTSDLLKAFRSMDRKIKFMRKICKISRLPYLEIGYEDLRSEDSKFDEILKYLGIKPGYYKLKTSLKKLNKGLHRELIKNYNEVKLKLENTCYAEFIK